MDSPPAPTTPRRLVVAALAALWLIGVAGGSLLLSRYDQTPGPTTAAAAPTYAPAAFPVPLEHSAPTLVMFAHPHCPCTRASLAELNKLLSRNPAAHAHLLFFTPTTSGPDWTTPRLRTAASKLDRLTTHDDPDGQWAAAFGAETSGTVVVLSPAGQVLFRGGITPGRGHQGDNTGSDAVGRLLRSEPCDLSATPVFGCSLVSPDHCARCAEGPE